MREMQLAAASQPDATDPSEPQLHHRIWKVVFSRFLSFSCRLLSAGAASSATPTGILPPLTPGDGIAVRPADDGQTYGSAKAPSL